MPLRNTVLSFQSVSCQFLVPLSVLRLYWGQRQIPSTANRTALARKAPARAMGTIANELKRESAPMCTRPNHVLTASIGPLWKRNKSMAEAIAPNVSCPSATGNMTPSERNQFRIDQAMVMSKTAIKKTSAAIPREGFFSEDTLPARSSAPTHPMKAARVMATRRKFSPITEPSRQPCADGRLVELAWEEFRTARK